MVARLHRPLAALILSEVQRALSWVPSEGRGAARVGVEMPGTQQPKKGRMRGVVRSSGSSRARARDKARAAAAATYYRPVD